MNFNPLMLLPLLLGNKNGGDNNDMTKMLEMMNVLKDGNPDAVLNALPVDEKTKTMLNMVKGMSALNDTQPAETATVSEPEKQRPDTRFFGEDINRALSKLMNNS